MGRRVDGVLVPHVARPVFDFGNTLYSVVEDGNAKSAAGEGQGGSAVPATQFENRRHPLLFEQVGGRLPGSAGLLAKHSGFVDIRLFPLLPLGVNRVGHEVAPCELAAD
jgi:hypothetical protein